MVKNMRVLVTPPKKITPISFRAPTAPAFTGETGDIYLVASVLGHSDVNTTRKHYAAQEDQRRKSARNIVQLREKKRNRGPSSLASPDTDWLRPGACQLQTAFLNN